MTLLLGDSIRVLRARGDLTQQELSEQTGISRAYISLLESNQVIPSDDWLHRIKDALGWDTEADCALAMLGRKEPIRCNAKD